jgi:hypothetical protein
VWRGVRGDGWILAAAVTILMLVTLALAAPLLTAGVLALPSFPRHLLLIRIVAACFMRGSRVGDFFIGEFGEYSDYRRTGVIW